MELSQLTELLRRAEALAEQGQLSEALQILDEPVRTTQASGNWDQSELVLLARASLYQRADRWEDVRAELEPILQTDPARPTERLRLASLWCALGQAYEHLGQPQAAIRAYEQAIAVDTDPALSASWEAASRLSELAPSRLQWIPTRMAFEAAIAHAEDTTPWLVPVLLIEMGGIAYRLDQLGYATDAVRKGQEMIQQGTWEATTHRDRLQAALTAASDTLKRIEQAQAEKLAERQLEAGQLSDTDEDDDWGLR